MSVTYHQLPIPSNENTTSANRAKHIKKRVIHDNVKTGTDAIRAHPLSRKLPTPHQHETRPQETVVVVIESPEGVGTEGCSNTVSSGHLDAHVAQRISSFVAKPASLRMSAYDRPETYGLVPKSYRTSKSMHLSFSEEPGSRHDEPPAKPAVLPPLHTDEDGSEEDEKAEDYPLDKVEEDVPMTVFTQLLSRSVPEEDNFVPADQAPARPASVLENLRSATPISWRPRSHTPLVDRAPFLSRLHKVDSEQPKLEVSGTCPIIPGSPSAHRSPRLTETLVNMLHPTPTSPRTGTSALPLRKLQLTKEWVAANTDAESKPEVEVEHCFGEDPFGSTRNSRSFSFFASSRRTSAAATPRCATRTPPRRAGMKITEGDVQLLKNPVSADASVRNEPYPPFPEDVPLMQLIQASVHGADRESALPCAAGITSMRRCWVHLPGALQDVEVLRTVQQEHAKRYTTWAKAKTKAHVTIVETTVGESCAADSLAGSMVSSGPSGARKWNHDFQKILDKIASAQSAHDVVKHYNSLSRLHKEFIAEATSIVTRKCHEIALQGVVEEHNITFAFQSTSEIPTVEDAALLLRSSTQRPSIDLKRCSKMSNDDDKDDEAEMIQALWNEVASKYEKERKLDLSMRRTSSSLQQQKDVEYKAPTRAEEKTVFLAHKFCGVDLRGLSAVSSAWFPSQADCDVMNGGRRPLRVCFPLCCTVSYLGHTFTCTATLPTDLVFHAEHSGWTSSDVAHEGGGDLPTTEQCDEADAYLALVGSQLRLRPYLHFHTDAGSPRRSLKLVPMSQFLGLAYSSSESRFYITCGVSVTPPIPNDAHCHAASRFRPEAVVALCADSLSDDVTSHAAPDIVTESGRTVKAFRRLQHRVATDAVERLIALGASVDGSQLCLALQEQGINLCLLGPIANSVAEKLQALKQRPRQRSLGDAVENTLKRLLQTLKEEMVARVFRWLLAKVWRDTTCQVEPLFCGVTAMAMASELCAVLFGAESNSRTHGFWTTHIHPLVRSRFSYSGALSRSDVSIRTALHRISSLCGLEFGPAAEATSDPLIKLELRSTRAYSVGDVISLTPRVKAICMPSMPPLNMFESVDMAVIPHLRGRIDAQIALSGSSTHPCVFDATLRLAEALCGVGDEHYVAAEALLLKQVEAQEKEAMAVVSSVVQTRCALASLYHSQHRYLEGTKQLQAAILHEAALTSSLSPTLVGLLERLATMSLDGGDFSVAISSLECACANLLHLITSGDGDATRRFIIKSRFHVQSAAANTVNGTPTQADIFRYDEHRTKLASLKQTLSVTYTSVPNSKYPPVPEQCAFSAFAAFLFDAACEQLRNSRYMATLSILARLRSVVVLLQNNGSEALRSALQRRCSLPGDALQRCDANIAAVEAMST